MGTPPPPLPGTRSLDQRCIATLAFIGDEPIHLLFTQPFRDILLRNRNKLAGNQLTLIDNVIANLAQVQALTLRQMYALEPYQHYPQAVGSLGAAGAEFVVPFLSLGGTLRAKAESFLADAGADPNDDSMPFLDAFRMTPQRDCTVNQLFAANYSQLNIWQVKLLREARSLGIVRAFPLAASGIRILTQGKGYCAYQKNDGTWDCRLGQSEDSCHIDTATGLPTAASDICGL